MNKQPEEFYPRWMQRWNAWTRRADLAIITFAREFGDLVSEAMRDMGYRLDKMIFGTAKDELSRQRAAVGTPDYEYWRQRIESENAESRNVDRW